MMDLTIKLKSIPHKNQRYDTCGDWVWPRKRKLRITVSHLSHESYELLVGLHELIEAMLCKKLGVSADDVDRWDEEYEKARTVLMEEGVKAFFHCGCEITATSEPGDDIHCPYGPMHKTATRCEKEIAKALQVVWKDYNDEVESL